MTRPKMEFVHHPWGLARHMLSGAMALLPLAVITLAIGMAIYHWVEGRAWSDAFLNSAMLLGGMGPVDRLETTAGKWLAGVYALYVAVLRPGRFARTSSADGPLEPGEVREVTTTLMGVATGQTESTEIGYFYRGGKWIHVWIAD